MNIQEKCKTAISCRDTRLRVVRYVGCGGMAAAVNLGAFWSLKKRMLRTAANLIAILLSIAFAYVTNKKLVFCSRCPSRRALLREAAGFFVGRGLTMLIDVGSMLIFSTILGLYDMAVKVLSNLFVILVNYAVSKFFVFRETGQRSAAL